MVWQRIETPHWEQVLKRLVEQHVRETQSRYRRAPAAPTGSLELPKFWQVVPKEMLSRVPYPLTRAEEAKRASAGAADD